MSSKDLVQPEPRKDAEVKKLYADLIARVTLRTLSEAFDAAPVALVGDIVFKALKGLKVGANLVAGVSAGRVVIVAWSRAGPERL